MTTNTLFDQMQQMSGLVDQDTVEKLAISFPTAQWGYGNQTLAKKGLKDFDAVGGFFIPEDQVNSEDVQAALLANGWVKCDKNNSDGSTTSGFHASVVLVSWVRDRLAAEYKVDGRSFKLPLRKWDDARKAAPDGRVYGRGHALVIFKGLEEFGPFVITVAGTAQMAMFGTREDPGVKGRFLKVVCTAAKKAFKGNAVPMRMFWMKVGITVGTDGKPVFVERGKKEKSWLMMPSLYDVPASMDKVTQKNLEDWFVGHEVFAKANALYKENEVWATAWDSLTGNEKHADDGDTSADAAEVPTVSAEALGM